MNVFRKALPSVIPLQIGRRWKTGAEDAQSTVLRYLGAAAAPSRMLLLSLPKTTCFAA